MFDLIEMQWRNYKNALVETEMRKHRTDIKHNWDASLIIHNKIKMSDTSATFDDGIKQKKNLSAVNSFLLPRLIIDVHPIVNSRGDRKMMTTRLPLTSFRVWVVEVENSLLIDFYQGVSLALRTHIGGSRRQNRQN